MDAVQEITKYEKDRTIQGKYGLADFWEMRPERRAAVLLRAIQEGHAWHFERNPAYRRAVSARGVRAQIAEEDLPRILRQTSQTFKSYIEILGTPFPQDKPREFVEWLDEQLSVRLPRERFGRIQRRYRSLEALLADIEAVFGDFQFEISTSSGTSGRSTILVRDREAIDKTVESLYLSFQRYMGMQADHRVIFIMPKETRIAMARFTGFCIERLETFNGRVHYTIPFPARPDQVRIRAGRTFRDGWAGQIERRLWHPLINWANKRYATPRSTRETLRLLRAAEAAGEKALLFGGWVHLHSLAREVLAGGHPIQLPPGSLLGTGGGFKEVYAFTPAQIRGDLALALQDVQGQPLPFHDVYGMAESNWAAMQCREGSYHIPPWVYALTLDEDDNPQMATEATGLLAFYDPFGGGRLFPGFFKSADQVRLVNPPGRYDPALDCACGEVGAYIAQGSIQRVDLMEEAGCAAQV